LDAWLLALIGGILGGGVGVFFALKATGCFQYMGGNRGRPDAIGKKELEQRILSLNDPSKPYRIVRDNDTDLIAEWKIVDASWYGVFSKNRITEVYRAKMLLDEDRHTVRCYEELGSVNWSAGTSGLVPSVHYQRSFFGGRILYKKSRGKAYGIKNVNPTELGKVYNCMFDIDRIRQPIMTVVEENGWEWVPVTAQRHATYKARA
jgi:hypothetical protein